MVADVVEAGAVAVHLEILQRVRVSKEKTVLLRLIRDDPPLTQDGANEGLLGVVVSAHHMFCLNDLRLCLL